ncbi:MAG: DUF1702 family protein [Bacteroidetes bacterium]|nr:DUF1702 family protein [Bacteroidota bacterium]
MNVATDRVKHKMENIQHIFREVQDSFPETYLLQELTERLDAYEQEFRSVAYEAASMCIALKAFPSWQEFLKFADDKHQTQIHIGLGWALANQSTDPTDYLARTAPMSRYRVMDGYGYYEGIFRKRKSILNQERLVLKDETALKTYDQGLGRSIWYLNQGDWEQTMKTLNTFSEKRKNDLFRGLGIAITYVGGMGVNILNEMRSSSGIYQTQMATGAAMAVVSRHTAGYIPEDTQHICRAWFSQDSKEIMKENELIKCDLDLTKDDAYEKWIQRLEGSIVSKYL